MASKILFHQKSPKLFRVSDPSETRDASVAPRPEKNAAFGPRGLFFAAPVPLAFRDKETPAPPPRTRSFREPARLPRETRTATPIPPKGASPGGKRQRLAPKERPRGKTRRKNPPGRPALKPGKHRSNPAVRDKKRRFVPRGAGTIRGPDPLDVSAERESPLRAVPGNQGRPVRGRRPSGPSSARSTFARAFPPPFFRDSHEILTGFSRDSSTNLRRDARGRFPDGSESASPRFSDCEGFCRPGREPEGRKQPETKRAEDFRRGPPPVFGGIPRAFEVACGAFGGLERLRAVFGRVSGPPSV
jgi:hypothetical protein